MDELPLVILAAVPALWAMVARRMEPTPLTGPLAMTACGIVLGPAVLGWLDLNPSVGAANAFLTITLVIVLFTDAAQVDISTLRREESLPARLLGIGLPLTVLFGVFAAALLFDEFGPWEAAVLAVALAPTDASLGLVVVENPRVPAVIRHGLNAESGLNDGLAVPLFVLAVAGAQGEYSSAGEVVRIIVTLVLLAVLTGIVVGRLASWLVDYSADRGWSNAEWRMVALPLFALIAYGVAELIGGSGFVAAFVAGVTVASTMRQSTRELTEGGSSVGHLLTLVAYLIFGASVVGPIVGESTWIVFLYAVLSLTAIRMIPVALALVGSGLKGPTVAFVGWFGPRGLASIIFAGELLEDVEFDGSGLVAHTIAITVALSVLLHGITSSPLADRYADWIESSRPKAEQAASPPVTRRLRIGG